MWGNWEFPICNSHKTAHLWYLDYLLCGIGITCANLFTLTTSVLQQHIFCRHCTARKASHTYSSYYDGGALSHNAIRCVTVAKAWQVLYPLHYESYTCWSSPLWELYLLGKWLPWWLFWESAAPMWVTDDRTDALSHLQGGMSSPKMFVGKPGPHFLYASQPFIFFSSAWLHEIHQSCSISD